MEKGLERGGGGLGRGVKEDSRLAKEMGGKGNQRFYIAINK